MNFSFKYAVASKPGFAGDRIVVSVSQDCGESWQSARTLLGPVLYAATSKANPWNPASSNNWRSININLDDYIGADPIMIKIDFISGGGNNAFLDDFKLVTVLDNEEISIEDVLIIPTPSNGLFQVRGLPSGSEYVIYTVDGRLIQKGRLNFERSIHLESPQGYYIFQSGGLRKPIIIQ